MPLPVRHLPVLQNWDCRGCTNCCHDYRVYLSDAERGRLAIQIWNLTPWCAKESVSAEAAG